MYFDDTSDFDTSRADLIHFVEEYDKLSMSNQSHSSKTEENKTVLVQAQIETNNENTSLTNISSNQATLTVRTNLVSNGYENLIQ